MMLTRCLLLMIAIAVNTLVAGQTVPIQGDKPIDEIQQEASMNMVSVEPVLVQEDGSIKGGEQELPTVAGEPVLYKTGQSIDEEEPVLTMAMVSENPPFVEGDGGDQKEGSIEGGEQELPVGTAAGEPAYFDGGENKSIDEGEPVQTFFMVSENPPFVDLDEQQAYTMNMVPEEQMNMNGGDQKDGSIGGGEQQLPVGMAAGEPAYFDGGENKSIDEGEPVQTIEMVSENPPFVDYDEQQAYTMNMVPEEQMNMVSDGPFPVMYMAADELATLELTSTNTQCPLMFGCCEEDCCGAGTSWQIPYCTIDLDSTGFNGTHSSDWSNGCIERICCEEECCSPETKYDGGTAECVPKGTA